MSILSFSFLAFVLILLVVYYMVPQKNRWIILLLGSIYFYYLSSKNLIVFILLSTVIIYFLGIILDKYNDKIAALKEANLSEDEKKNQKEQFKSQKKKIVIIGVLLNILGIVVTKYSGFVLENINNLLHLTNINFSFTITKILVPLGISYYTLEAISYIVDIYRGKYKAETKIFKVALYLLYFPKIIEGPISKFNTLSKDFFESNNLDFKNITIGLDLVIYGLFKKWSSPIVQVSLLIKFFLLPQEALQRLWLCYYTRYKSMPSLAVVLISLEVYL